jgi:hypothetical protein
MPGSNRPFLDAGEAGRRGAFGDPRVLLHIPPGFDANKPSVMIVFFHGHGAILSRDVRAMSAIANRCRRRFRHRASTRSLSRPSLPSMRPIRAPGKFGEPGGFKRFLDEAAGQLAKLHGDSRTKQTFANVPIVIVAYSGGFGPTLSVLDNGGVKPRIRGIVLLDALYSGINKFANWIGGK